MSVTFTGPRALTNLDLLPAGRRALVVEVEPEHAGELLREGVFPGAGLCVRSVAPLGGPVIVEVGQATVAIARPIAATVRLLAESGRLS